MILSAILLVKGFSKGAYTMQFSFHDPEIFFSKEKCRDISGSEMRVVKYYSVCLDNQVSFIRS